MIRALILLILAACTTSKSAEQHAEVAQEVHAEQQGTQSVQQETHSEEGEWTRRTWEFGAGDTAGSVPERPPALSASPSASKRRAADPQVAQTADAGHPSFLGWPTDGDTPPLLRYTEETHAPAHVDTSTLAQSASQAAQDAKLKAHVEAQSASKTSYWPPWWVWAGAALALAAALWLARGKIKLALEAVRALVG